MLVQVLWLGQMPSVTVQHVQTAMGQLLVVHARFVLLAHSVTQMRTMACATTARLALLLQSLGLFTRQLAQLVLLELTRMRLVKHPAKPARLASTIPQEQLLAAFAGALQRRSAW